MNITLADMGAMIGQPGAICFIFDFYPTYGENNNSIKI